MKKLFLTLGLCLTFGWSFAQANPFDKLFLESKRVKVYDKTPLHFFTRVNLLDVFFERFNMRMNLYGEPITPKEITAYGHTPNWEQQWQETRQKVVMHLTDAGAYYSNKERFGRFLSELVEDDAYLSFRNGQWYAVADAAVSYNGKDQDVKIILGVVADGPGYKWVIYDVQLLELSPPSHPNYPSRHTSNLDTMVYISPVAHEVNFIELKSLFNENIDRILSQNYPVDKREQLFQLIDHKKLKLKYIEKVKYAFFDVPGFVFFVDYFNRKKPNSGWLISRIEKKPNIIEDLDWLKQDIQ